MKTKIIYYIFIYVYFSLNNLQAQEKQQQTQYFYKTAIEECINQTNNIKYFYARKIPIKHLNEISNDLKFIDIYDKKNKKLIKRGIKIFFIEPIFVSKNNIIIIVRNYKVTYKKHKYNFINKGGAKITFTYYCNENKWKIQKTDIFTI